MKNKVGIISLGCAKNRVDAEMLIAKLDKSKFELIEDVAMADAAIINTCAFIEGPVVHQSLTEHSIKDTSMDRFKPIAYIGQCTAYDNGHRIVDISRLHDVINIRIN